MEETPQNNESVAEKPYDREAVAEEAMETAKSLLEENISPELQGVERFDAMIVYMETLAQENENRHVVEAIARVLKIMKADHEAYVAREDYPKAAEATDALAA